MKRKPDTVVAIIALFFVGIAVTGFSSAVNDKKPQSVPVQITENR